MVPLSNFWLLDGRDEVRDRNSLCLGEGSRAAVCRFPGFLSVNPGSESAPRDGRLVRCSLCFSHWIGLSGIDSGFGLLLAVRLRDELN